MTTSLPEPFTVNGRYEITGGPLGEGGMGAIYKAYDAVTKRFVALKTLAADATPASTELFERESSILARLSHPNIVDILDTGDWMFQGRRRLYFVMPLLPGRTLEEIIRNSSERLGVERTVDIICQACRGLQAAHDQNLVHRDIKPSNIFVMDDDTVKIIDFGVSPLAADSDGDGGVRGTPLYMAPEQLERKPATTLSDIFSLANVCYEALTGRQPFARPTADEIAEAVRSYIPPAASELNPAVNQLVSRTVHKAMAKQPWHRFTNAREFGDTLQKALRNEPIERFERSKILPRIERVKKAYAEGDYQFALEILRELESEGHVDPDMSVLHIQVDQALRQKNVRQLLDNARIRMEEEEFPLALQKVEDALALEPGHADAEALKQQIEKQRDETQLSHWFRLVKEHLNNNLFGQARQGLQEVLKIDSAHFEAREMLAAIDKMEQDLVTNREEKQRLYESAVESHRNGEASEALAHLEKALALARRTARSSSPDLDAQCQSFYDSIRGERDSAQNAYQEGRQFLLENKVDAALAICDEYLRKRPNEPRFQALKLEAEEMQREAKSAALAEISRRADAEPDLDRKLQLLENAVEAHPDETHFRSALKLITDRRDLVNAIVARARHYEDRNQFADAISEMEILRNIYPLFPSLDAEMTRLTRRKEEQIQIDAKARWIEQIDGHLNAAEYDTALSVFPEALAAFPDDADLLHRKALAEQGVARHSEANSLLKEGQDLCAARNFKDGVAALRKAERLDPRSRAARAALLSGLVSHARDLMPTDWHAAEPLVKEALDLEPTDPVARSLLSILDDNRRQSAINIILAGARNYQTDGHFADAIQILERGLVQYPNDHRLVPLLATLRAQAGEPPIQPARPMRTAPAPVVAEAAAVAPEPDPVLPEAPAQQPKPARPPRRNFFAPPTTDMPPKEPPADGEPDGSSALGKALMNRPKSVARRPPLPRRPPPSVPLHDPSEFEKFSFKGPIWLVAGVCALLLIVSAVVYQVVHDRLKSAETATSATSSDARTKGSAGPSEPDAPPPVHYPVSLESNVPGTRFSEEGQTLDATALLTAGKHNIEAFHEGYLTDTKAFTIDSTTAAPPIVRFDLRPILPLLRLNSAITHGRLVLDNEALDLQAGVASKEDLPLGAHSVKIFDGKRQVFAFVFETKANQIPTLLAPLASQPVAGVVVAALSGSAKIYATSGLRAGAALPVAEVPITGLSLGGSSVNPAHFLLDLGKGKGPQQQSVDTSVFPSITVQLAGADVGAVDFSALSITTNAANCEVFVDGQPLARNAKGEVVSNALEPGTHPVRLSCPGFQEMTKVANVRGGQISPRKLDFTMTAIPEAAVADNATAAVRHAQLVLAGAPPETPVFQNQIRIGTVAADGTFAREIDPGTFTWEWRKAGYETRKETRTVKAGETIHLDGAMVSSAASLVVKVTPDNAQISIHRESDNTAIAASNNVPLTLAAGTYRVSAQAPEYRERVESIVAAGKPLSLNWSLEKAPVLSMPARFFENGEGWKPFPDEQGWWIHQGSGYSPLRASTGTVSIDFLRQKRARKVNILADCQDHANCIVYSLDGHTFTSKVVSGGATVSDEKKAHGMDNQPSYHLIFEMSPETIVVKNQAGTVLSSVDRQNPRGKLSIQDDVPLNIN